LVIRTNGACSAPDDNATYLRDGVRDPANAQICQQENNSHDEEHQGEKFHLHLQFVVGQLESHDQARQ
jgi:hypothetical protein